MRTSRGPSEGIQDAVLHSIHMKRTNLVLNEQLLEEATRLSGERTYSRAVERALEDFVRRARARRILDLAGSGVWEGDLATVREDRGVYRTKRRGSR
jgi:Arc/MetJ family transcription regulator